jgi:thermitase
MKKHIIIKLRSVNGATIRPHWSDVTRDKTFANTALSPSLAKLLERYNFAVWYTREYVKHGADWSADEIQSGLDRVFRLILKKNQLIPPELTLEMRRLPEIESAEVGRIGVASVPEAQLQPVSLANSIVQYGSHQRMINLSEAHAVTKGRSDVLIAILDTGAESSHPEFEKRSLQGRDFVNIINGATNFIGDFIDADADPSDDVGHGTHVCGIISAKGLNMPIGVAPSCRFLPVRVLAAMRKEGQKVGAGSIENINSGIKFAVDQGAAVINMSLGVKHEGGGLPHKDIVDYARRKGVLIVAASGNDGAESLYYPGALPGVLAVGSQQASGQVSNFSTFGPQVAVIAPGENVYSAFPDRSYAFATGTSHAAPFVSGVAALIKSVGMSRGAIPSGNEIKDIITRTSDRSDSHFRDHHAGYGRLNAVDALRLAESRMH